MWQHPYEAIPQAEHRGGTLGKVRAHSKGLRQTCAWSGSGNQPWAGDLDLAFA